MLVASVFTSLVEIFASSFSAGGAEGSWAAFALLRAEVGTRCWIMVLFTAYLKDGEPPVGDDSEMTERRMEFCVDRMLEGVWSQFTVDSERGQHETTLTIIVVFHDSVFECS